MTTRALIAGLLLALLPLSSRAELQVVIIEGLGGEPAYQQQFDAEVHALSQASASLTGSGQIHVLAGRQAQRGGVQALFKTLAGQLTADDTLVLYLVGHGSFDGIDYRFNIPGPDLSAHDLGVLLNALSTRRQLIVATGSASGALLEALKSPARTLITATRSGNEKNATRFGTEFAAALAADAADSNKDQTISAREAFEYANRRVQDYFEHEALLASEHAVLQGDGGSQPLASLRPVAADVSLSHDAAPAAANALTRQRDALNARIEAMRARKQQMPSEQYSQQLEALLIELAQLQQRIDAGENPDGSTDAQ